MTVRIDTGLGDVVDVSAVVAGSVSDTWQAAFGTYTAPGAGQSATATDAGSGNVTVSLTVGAGHYNPASGTYWLWVNRNGLDWVNTDQRYVVTTTGGTDIGSAVNPVLTVEPGTNVTVDDTDPQHPVVSATGGGTVTASQITDSTTIGRSVLTAADAPTVRAAIGADASGAAASAQSAAIAAAAADASTKASPQGAWSSATAYAVNAIVTYNGNTYRAKATSTNITPDSDASKWESWGGGGTPVLSWWDNGGSWPARGPASGAREWLGPASAGQPPERLAADRVGLARGL